ncbi:multidrug effflux MFS transporter [Comamonas sp. Y33R10-2]|uniref:multidrug effflux MFS transporter n=1 Tax=Comamonas sp. Y33R10-2 TaxID=2853257 RepID=UPI001C5C932C|nr:multidrug effflux MFS transporter [Comamonas sp. Y33R10-2]QXZ10041.1 multidrug effflux MFS transporter [Comamonas sp. Y33R10-2]
MQNNFSTFWRGPRWALAMLLAILGMLGPFAIDTYIPAFSGIAKALGATPVEMQQTLSAYLFGFAFMNLFHGALADSFGRRPVILWGLVMFTLASAGCAMSQNITQLVLFRTLQGLSTGAGIVVSRAIVRDIFPPNQAQSLMAQITIFFGIAPALAPVMGGWLLMHLGWQSIFWFLTLIGVLLWAINVKFLPESLPIEKRQPFQFKPLMQGYRTLLTDPRFVLLALASGIPFNGMFLYLLSAPAFLGDVLKLEPTQFFWFFIATIGGIMAGSWTSGKLAGRIAPKKQIRHGFVVMFATSIINLVANLIWPAHVSWALLPICLFAYGWALMVPVVTLLVLDVHPERRGLASSLQAVVGSVANGLVAGVIAPLVMHSAVLLAIGSIVMMLIGLAAWMYLHRHWPEIGRTASEL